MNDYFRRMIYCKEMEIVRGWNKFAKKLNKVGHEEIVSVVCISEYVQARLELLDKVRTILELEEMLEQ